MDYSLSDCVKGRWGSQVECLLVNRPRLWSYLRLSSTEGDRLILDILILKQYQATHVEMSSRQLGIENWTQEWEQDGGVGGEADLNQMSQAVAEV